MSCHAQQLYGVAGGSGGGLLLGGAGHWSAGDEQLHCASLDLYTLLLVILSSILLFLFPLCLIKLSLSQATSFYFFPPDSLPHPTGGQGRASERLCGAELPAGLNHNSPLAPDIGPKELR